MRKTFGGVMVSPYRFTLPTAPFEYRRRVLDAMCSLKLSVRVAERSKAKSDKLDCLQLISETVDEVMHHLEWAQATANIVFKDELILQMNEMTERLRGD
jgi:hypothetical protein